MHVGNVINNSDKRLGAALGINCLDWRIFDKYEQSKTTLLEYIVKKVFETDPKVLEDIEQLGEKIKKSCDFDINNTADDVYQKKADFDKLAITIKSCDDMEPVDTEFKDYFCDFYVEIKEDLENLEKDMEKQQQGFIDCMIYLGEIDRKVKAGGEANPSGGSGEQAEKNYEKRLKYRTGFVELFNKISNYHKVQERN